MEKLLFILFSFLTLICGMFVINSKNPIHSVLFLILVFFNIAGLLIMLGIEFLALLFLIVYVGAIAVLFLFIIMMLSIKIPEYKIVIQRYFPIIFILGTGFFCEVLTIFEIDFSFLIITPFKNININNFYLNYIVFWSFDIIQITNIEIFSSMLYTHYAYVFVISGIILLVAMIGAITLTLHHRIDVKRQKVYKQIKQRFVKNIIWSTYYTYSLIWIEH
jgi:NADH-quinone oxidoreductase subunit J